MNQLLNHPRVLSASKSLLEALSRQKYTLLGTVGACMVLSMVAFKFVAKKYKIQATIDIQTQYFQNPLVRDFIPETFDGQELKAQRIAVIRRALSHDYLKALNAKYQLLTTKDQITTYDLEELSKKFEVVPTGATSFLIGIFHKDPAQGYEIMNEFIEHVRRNMVEERKQNLLRLQGAIQARLETLSFSRSNASPLFANRPDLLRQEVARINEEIEALRTTYSDKHPRITELRKRLKDMSAWLKPESGGNEEQPSQPVSRTVSFSGAKVDPASKELFQDLLRKYHYLEIVIDMDEQNRDAYLTLLSEPFIPQAAVWPKRPIFLIWGIAIGFLLGSMVALCAEILRTRLPKRGRSTERDSAIAAG